MPSKTWKNKLRNFLTPAMARKSGVVNSKGDYKESLIDKDVIEAAREFQTRPTRQLYRWLFSKGKPGFDFEAAIIRFSKAESKEEKEAIITSFILLRLILSGDLIVKVRGLLGRREEVIERSWSRLTRYEGIIRALGYLLPAVSFLGGTAWLADPGYADQVFNGIQIIGKADDYLSTVGTQFLSTRYNMQATPDFFAGMVKSNNDQDAFNAFTAEVMAKAGETGGSPSQAEINVIIANVNARYPYQTGGGILSTVSRIYSSSSLGSSRSYTMTNLVTSSLKNWSGIYNSAYHAGKILGFTGSISVSTISEITHGTLTHGILGMYRSLFKAVSRHYNYKDKKEMIKLIDTFLIEDPDTSAIILSREFRESIDGTTLMGFVIENYINALIEEINIRMDITRPSWFPEARTIGTKRFNTLSNMRIRQNNEITDREIKSFSKNIRGTNLNRENEKNRLDRTENVFFSKTMTRKNDLKAYENERKKRGFFEHLFTRKQKAKK